MAQRDALDALVGEQFVDDLIDRGRRHVTAPQPVMPGKVRRANA